MFGIVKKLCLISFVKQSKVKNVRTTVNHRFCREIPENPMVTTVQCTIIVADARVRPIVNIVNLQVAVRNVSRADRS